MGTEKLNFAALIQIRAALKLFHLLSDGAVAELIHDEAYQAVDYLLQKEKIEIGENYTDLKEAQELEQEFETLYSSHLEGILDSIRLKDELIKLQKEALKDASQMIAAQNFGITQLLKG